MGQRGSIGQGQAASQGQWRPVASLLLAATLWGVLWYPLRRLEAHGLAGLWATLIIYGAALAVAPLLFRGRPLRAPGQYGWLAGLAAASGWCNVAFILAVLNGTVVRVLLLFYLSPLWAVLLGRWLLGERLTRRALAVLALALTGAGIMLWDPGLGLPWPRDAADWLAASSGFAFAVSNVQVRRLQAVPVPLKTAVAWLGVVLLTVVWLAVAGEPPPQAGLAPLAVAAVIGILGMTTMTLAVQYGVSHMPVQRSAVILLFELVAGAASSLWLAGETVAPREWAGGVLIIAAAYLASRRETPAA